MSRAADSINYATPIWLAAGVLSAALAIASHRGPWRLAAWAALFVTLGTGGMNVVHSRGAPTVAREAELRIVQFNVTKRNLDPATAADWVAAQDADVVVLEEAAGSGARIKSRLDSVFPHAVDCLGATDTCSTIILSRRPFLTSGGLARGDPENRKTLSAAWATIADGGGAFTVIGVHMRRPWPYDDQTADLAQLSAFAATLDQKRLIIVGDFNQPPWTFAMRRQDRMLRVSRLTGNLATWPVWRLPTSADGRSLPMPTILPIDHAYAGEAWQVVSIERGPALGSDHRPLVIDLARASGVQQIG